VLIIRRSKLYYTASGITTLCREPSGSQVERCLLITKIVLRLHRQQNIKSSDLFVIVINRLDAQILVWGKKTNKMQQYKLKTKLNSVALVRERTIPTDRCNNIDGLLSIMDVDYWQCLNMFRASLCPYSGAKTTCYCIWSVFAGNVGCGRLRCCGAKLRVWSLWRFLFESNRNLHSDHALSVAPQHRNLPHPTLPANTLHMQ